LFPIGVFAQFNYVLVTTQNISVIQLPQIRKSTNGVQETSKLGGTSSSKTSSTPSFNLCLL
jgi:hypothetical protein